MANLTLVAKQARITAYKDGLKLKLSHRLIDTSKPAFADLFADGNPAKKMDSLNGEIILERDLYPDGRLRGVVSVHPDALAAILPDLKADTLNVMGWKKHLDKFTVEGKDILAGVADPDPSEYGLTAMEELLIIEVPPMSDSTGKQKLAELQTKAKSETI